MWLESTLGSINCARTGRDRFADKGMPSSKAIRSFKRSLVQIRMPPEIQLRLAAEFFGDRNLSEAIGSRRHKICRPCHAADLNSPAGSLSTASSAAAIGSFQGIYMSCLHWTFLD